MASRVTYPSAAECGHPSRAVSVKKLTESCSLTTVPPTHLFATDSSQVITKPSGKDHVIPVIDFSLLTSNDPQERSQIVERLTEACTDWGFFLVVNHGVDQSLVDGVIDGLRRFFNLTEEEKQDYEGKHVLDPIRCGTSFNISVDKSFFWRDFLKVFVHPEFHFPNKPPGFREISLEYCKKVRQVAREVLTGISEGLKLEQKRLETAIDYENGFQILVGNLYPPCPQPELTLGMPAHSDHGCLTFLVENGVNGLQVLHKGNWVTVRAPSNSFLVNIGDQLEILSNGKYTSNVHRVLVSNQARISVAVAHGPSLDTMVRPMPELVDDENYCEPSKYLPMEYREYLKLQQSNQLDGKSCLDHVRI